MMHSRLARLVLSLFSAVFIAIPGAFAEDKPPVVVKTISVQYQDYSAPIRTSGILTYKSQQTLSFKTVGPVQTLDVEEGDRVQKGQLLASLTLEEIKAQVDETRARVELARQNLDRFSRLHDTHVISLDRLQSAETDLAIASSQHRIALFNLQYSRISAPSAGVILRRFVEENELVSAHQPILLVADTSQGWIIRTGVTDEDIVRLKSGDKAAIQFDAWPNETFQGSISQIATLSNEKTGTFEVEIEIETSLPDSRNKLRSGFIGKVTITPSSKKNVTLIPVEAIIHSSKTSAEVFVYHFQTGTVRQRRISMDFIAPGFIASSSGLNNNDQLVTTGAGLLRDGEEALPAQGVN